MKTVTFFNNKGGVGKTSLVYHLAWMFSELGERVIAADLDPQANLSAAFLNEDILEKLWSDDKRSGTVFGSVRPLIRATGDFAVPHLVSIEHNLSLLVGDLTLSRFEDALSEVWPKCLDKDERAFRITSAFSRIIAKAAEIADANLVLIDVGPNLGAINRSALIASDYVVVPLAPDLFSLQGLRNLGPTLREWRDGWNQRFETNPIPDELWLPKGNMKTVGYVVLQHAVRLDRPTKAFEKWIAQIPGEYRRSILGEPLHNPSSVESDTNCLALLKHYRSLMPLAQEAQKPVFYLKPADGAIGAHAQAAADSFCHFEKLARQIAEQVEIRI